MAYQWYYLSASSLLFHFIFLSIVQAYNSPNDISKWCDQTPHPQQCNYHLRDQLPSASLAIIKGKQDFLKLSIQTALQVAMDTHRNTYHLGQRCLNRHENVAWSDCLELYEHAIDHLNATIGAAHRKSSNLGEDTQTWLSSALTYFDTCGDGFNDLQVTKNLMPLMTKQNVSYLISNALAISSSSSTDHNNRSSEKYESTTTSSKRRNQKYNDGGFPRWIKAAGDRRLLGVSASSADFVVAKDGTYKTIADAIDAASKVKGGSRRVIHIKAGVYNENLKVGKKDKGILLLGDGIGKTVITGSKSVGGGTTTFRSATVAVVGENFMAKGITFRNTAGASNNQAVALRSGSDLSVFYECSFEGYQDTLYAHSNRQFYRNCDIYGTVDFIFGNAAAVFQECNIYPRYHKTNTITAQSRTDPNQNTGISIQKCRVTPAPDLQGKSGVETYLGRPWKKYSRTVFMESYLGSLIDPAGWYPWNGDFALSTLYYGEYDNTGPGSGTSERVDWKGYHVITSASVASEFTAENFIGGSSWLPGTGVPFEPGL